MTVETSCTETLARFVVETQSVPQPVMNAARDALIDTVGVALGGARDAAVQMALRVTTPASAGAQAAVWGTGELRSIADAAFVNGIASHILDFDDALPTLRGHPSAPMVPVAIAIGEALDLDLHDVLMAYSVGLEVAGKLGKALGDTHYVKGWHNTATVGVFSGTAVAARLLGLKAPQLQHAWGIAASQAAGLVRNFGTMTKSFHVGHTARSAVVAALLAREGYTASMNVFDGAGSFLEVYSAEHALEPLVARLGAPWEAVDPGVHVKKWPCCYCNHRAIGGMLELMAQHRLTHEDVEEVRIGFPPGADEALIYKYARTGLEGKFSIEYSAAALLLDGELTLHTFTDGQVQRDAVQRLMRKIERYRVPIEGTYSGTIGFTDVAIRTATGVHSQRVQKTPGSPAWPMAADEEARKFGSCATQVLGTAAATALYETLKNAALTDSIAQITAALRRPVSAQA